MLHQKNMSTQALLGLGIALALGLITAAWIIGNAARQIKNAENSIEVKGYAERPIKSDQSSWNLTLTTDDVTPQAASQKFDQHKKKLADFLSQEGVDLKNFELAPLRQEIVYKLTDTGHTTNEIEKYKVSQSFSYRSHDVAQMTSLAINSGALIAEGLNLDIGVPRYSYTSQKLEALKLAMIGEATANGRQRAETFATNGGIKIGALKGARQGLFQVTSMDAADVSDYGVYDTSSVGKMVKVVVTLTYAVH